MKKYILFLALAAVATSCQKIQAGGNYDAIKIEDGVVRYSDADAAKPTYVPKPDSLKQQAPNLVEPALMMKSQPMAEETPVAE